jgi:hypothetical protein
VLDRSYRSDGRKSTGALRSRPHSDSDANPTLMHRRITKNSALLDFRNPTGWLKSRHKLGSFCKNKGQGISGQATVDQVAEYPAQRVAIGAGGGGEIADFGLPCFNVIGDAERGGDVHAPGGREVAEGPEVHFG